ncbi:MAG: hypothetical protein ACOCWP_00610, partial [Halanaerobium sp.]
EMNTAGQNREAAEELEEDIKERFDTDYVLEGSLNLDIEILESPEDSAEEEASENEASAEAAAESGAENEDENKNEQ